jgi:hypothetical protein
LLASAALVSSCAHESSREKGGLVTVAPASVPLQQAFGARRLALLVGINEVADEQWRTLKYADKDATDLAQALLDPNRGHYDDVQVLTHRSQTTREQLLRAVDAFVARANRPDDVVVLYISAHGTLGRDERGQLKRYLVTSDADAHHVSETALSIESLQSHFERAASRRRVLVLATCHSGGGKSALSPDVAAEMASLKGSVMPLEESSHASMVLSASDFGEAAREDDQLQNDVYTHYLVEGLSGAADRNVDGAVTASEAHDYARRRTWVFSNGRQRPSAEMVEVGADPIVLSGSVRRTGQPELFSYSTRLDGFTLRVDGESRLELPGGASVLPGSHRVELTKGDAVLASETMQLGLGQRIELEDLLHQRDHDVAVSLTGGAFGFVDQKSRTQLLPVGATLGASVRFDHALLRRIAIEVDGSGFSGTQTVALGGPALPMRWAAVQVGASALYSWERWDRLSLYVGPRVAGLWVQRAFALPAYQATQQGFSFTPGVLAGASLRLWGELEVSVRAELMMAAFSVDGTTQLLGFAGGWAGMGYRF